MHYRRQLNFTTDGLRQAQASIQRLEDFAQRMKEVAGEAPPAEAFAAGVAEARRRYTDAMDDDLNTSAALAAVFDFVRTTYQDLDRGAVTPGDAALALAFIREVDAVFAVLPPEPQLLDEEILRKIEERQAARRRRDFAEADAIRPGCRRRASSWKTPGTACAGKGPAESMPPCRSSAPSDRGRLSWAAFRPK